MAKKNFILMADVISSGSQEPMSLARDLKQMVETTNSNLSRDILSPLTVTLGDEFQGVCHSLSSTIQVIIHLERETLRNGRTFKLRYVVFEGIIETPINTETSYGMLGEGLTKARSILNDKSRSRSNVQCVLNDNKKQKLLNYVFNIFTNIWDVSSANRHPKILELLLFDQLSDKSIAEQTKKTRAEIWKFRQNWHISTYVSALNILREELY